CGMSAKEAIDLLGRKPATFDEYWAPRVVAQFNAHNVMVVKVKGFSGWRSNIGERVVVAGWWGAAHPTLRG
ncbi:hypothetical protein AB0118_26545, partial [Klebsiella quasipneumoniae]